MKKIFIILFVAIFLLSSCGVKKFTTVNEEEIDIEYDWANKIPQYPTCNCVIDIEGCEYFVYQPLSGAITFLHKGNCKNPIHNGMGER